MRTKSLSTETLRSRQLGSVLFSMSSTHGKTFPSRSFGSLLSACHLCSTSSPIAQFILMRLSIWLNGFENYHTESEYRTYLIIKVFSFRFVNYFTTLYYYVFVSSIVSEEE